MLLPLIDIINASIIIYHDLINIQGTYVKLVNLQSTAVLMHSSLVALKL